MSQSGEKLRSPDEKVRSKGESSFFNELLQIIRLAAPMTASNVGYVLGSINDTVVLGRIGAEALAGAAFTFSLTGTLTVFGLGVLNSVPIVSSQASGARLSRLQSTVLGTTFWLSTGMGALFALLLSSLNPLLVFFGQSPTVVGSAKAFLVIFCWSLIPGLGFMGIRGVCDALRKPVVPMYIQYAAVLISAAAGWIFAFGLLGAPRLGLLGFAWARLLSSTFAMLSVTAYALRLVSGTFADLLPRRINWGMIATFFHLGVPIGFQRLAEIAAFNFAVVMMGWLGTTALASHEIALTCIMLSYRLPLGISQAAIVQVGRALGGKNYLAIRKIAFGAILLSAVVMACCAGAFSFAGRYIAGLFTPDPDIVELTALLLMVAGVFQIADGIQVTVTGALRALSDVRIPMITACLCYWGIAIPAAYSCAFLLKLGPIGIWIGLASGIFAVAASNTFRFTMLTRFHCFASVVSCLPGE
jgi:multidrug resistance protein, MATE family